MSKSSRKKNGAAALISDYTRERIIGIAHSVWVDIEKLEIPVTEASGRILLKSLTERYHELKDFFGLRATVAQIELAEKLSVAKGKALPSRQLKIAYEKFIESALKASDLMTESQRQAINAINDQCNDLPLFVSPHDFANWDKASAKSFIDQWSPYASPPKTVAAKALKYQEALSIEPYTFYGCVRDLTCRRLIETVESILVVEVDRRRVLKAPIFLKESTRVELERRVSFDRSWLRFLEHDWVSSYEPEPEEEGDSEAEIRREYDAYVCD